MTWKLAVPSVNWKMMLRLFALSSCIRSHTTRLKAELAKYPERKICGLGTRRAETKGALYQIRHRIEDVISEEQNCLMPVVQAASPAVGYQQNIAPIWKQLVEDALTF